jgi:CheY-like chemotaxis protein
MPVLDGVGATRAIRSLADRAAATVPIVALTADADPETRDRCTVAGMNDFLTKPVGPEKLAALLRRLFGAGAGAAADASASRTAPNFAGDAGSALVDAGAIAAALQAMPRERLAALIHGFLDDGDSTTARLRGAVRDAQTAELRVNAHAARGAALNLGLPALAATAEALHDGAAKLPAHEIARLVQRFADLQVETRRAVEAAGLPRRQAAAPAAPAVTR